MTRLKNQGCCKGIILCFFALIWAFIPLVGSAQSQTPDDYNSTQSFADSKNLNVYQSADLKSQIVGTLIYGESIVIVVGSEAQGESGTWLRIMSPFNGYYLRTSSEIESSQNAGRSKQVNYFEKSAPSDLQQTDLSEQEEEVAQETDQTEEAAVEEEDDPRNELKAYFTDWLDRKNDRFSIGLGLSLITSAEEGSLTSDGIPLDIHLNFPRRNKLLSKIRLGMNNISFSWDDNQITLMTIYGAFIVRTDEVRIKNMEAFALIGPAYMSANIGGDASGEYQGFGLMGGFGGYYKLSSKMRIGGQWLYFSNQADMGGVQVDIGSNQIQLIGLYSF